MAFHPFFDAPTYPWPRPEAPVFHDALARLVPVDLVGILFPRFGGDLTQLNQRDWPSNVWREVLNQLTIARGLKGLCEWCRDESPSRGSATLQTAVQAVFNAEFMTPRRVIDDEGSQLMFDRQPLWTDIARLATRTDRARMLLVGGGRQSGKSHLRNLFELAAGERGRAEVVYLTKDLVSNDQEVVDSLAARLGVEITVPDTTDRAWYKKVINKLLGAANESGTEWWIVVDDLGDDEQGVPLMARSVRDFFHQFGLTYVDPQFRQRFRLMLIGLPPEGRATNWDRSAYVERMLSEADVTPSHVSEALLEGARRRRKSLTPQGADELAEKVFAAARRTREEGLAAASQTPGVAPPSLLQCLHDAALIALNAL